MSFDKKQLSDLAPVSKVKVNEPLSRHTTFKTGGAADFFIEVSSPLEMGILIDLLRHEDMPYYLLGRGSNVLASDDGFRGVVIRPMFDSVFMRDDTLVADAGASLATVCMFAAANGLSGLEFATGIPGTVGGAVMMNAGAYGREISDVLLSAVVFDIGKGFSTVGAIGMGLSYRHCRRLSEGSVLYRAEFKVAPDDNDAIVERMGEIINKRKDSQPLEYPSAGSIFKRPPGNYAGKLIEDCGLKGYTVGRAAVSEKHAGFIINLGDATSADIYELIRHVRRIVLDRTGVELQPEVRFLGEFPE